MKRGTAGLIGFILLICGVIYAGIFADSDKALPGWPAVVLIVGALMVLAWSNTKED